MRKLLLLLLAVGLLALIALTAFIPFYAAKLYGPPSPTLGPVDRFQYAALMLWYDGYLTTPVDNNGAKQTFKIVPGESVASIAYSLYEAGLVHSPSAFRDYLVYSGLDRGIQSGEFELSPAMPAIAIANELQDATPGQLTLGVLAGWRMEEISESFGASGLSFSPDEFLAAARTSRTDFDFLPEGATAEGFLFPGKYVVPRDISAEDMVTLMIRNFALYLSPDLRRAIERQGMTVYEAVIIASMVEREAIVDDEMPLIASVFNNRRLIGMKFDSDPTVQYAIGWNGNQGTWWTNPLSLADLQVDSPYNTYRYNGFPPAPICNPSLEAIRAVAYPAETPYYYFRAACDKSGRHNFAVTYQEHINNACP